MRSFPVSPKIDLERQRQCADWPLRHSPAGVLHVTELVVIQPPAALASFLDQRRYLPMGVPMLKRILGPAEPNRLPLRPRDHR